MIYEAATVDGEDKLRVHLESTMDPLERDWQKTYGSELGADLPPSAAPPCQYFTYLSFPLRNYDKFPKAKNVSGDLP